MSGTYSQLEEVRNVLEVLRIAAQPDLIPIKDAKRIRKMAFTYLDELLPERIELME